MVETWRAGETSVELLRRSSAWMARVDGWWIGKGGDEGGEEREMVCRPLGGAAGGMLYD